MTEETIHDARQVVAEAAAVGGRIDIALEQMRRRTRLVLALTAIVVLSAVGVFGYIILSNQDANHKIVVQTRAAVHSEYEVACGVAAHYGVDCPPFPKAVP